MIETLLAFSLQTPIAQVKVCNTAPLTVKYELAKEKHEIPAGECLQHTFARPKGALYIPFKFNRSPLPEYPRFTDALVVHGGEYTFVDLGHKILFWRMR